MKSSIFWDVMLCSLLNDISEERVTIFDMPIEGGKLASCSSALKIEVTFSSKSHVIFSGLHPKSQNSS
jgi:hypothetical protein